MFKKFLLDNYSKKILAHYEKNVSCLSTGKIGHFFSRAYKISNQKKYADLLALYVYASKIKRFRTGLENLRCKNFSTTKKNSSETKSERLKRRMELYAKYPAINFFDEMAIHMLFLAKYGLDKKILRNEFEEFSSLLKKEDLEGLYLNEDCLRYDSSFAFNTLIIFERFKIASLSERAENLLKKMYLNSDFSLKKELPDYEFSSLIYSLTHIIIAKSNFYDNFVSESDWIIDFFKKNFSQIKKRVSDDILAEVGLCIKLCQKEKACQKELAEIFRHFIQNKYFKDIEKPEFLLKKEHTNSILMLLFSKKINLTPGPNLENYKIFNQ